MNGFNFFVPFDIEKSQSNSKDDSKYDNMYLQGLASDSNKDRQDEVLEPSGFDISDFLKSGLVNLEHYQNRKGDPKFWIGEPVSGHIKDNKFFVKVKLWKEQEMARNFYDTALAMKKSKSTRKPGFSIEGIPLERDPFNKKRITKAKITNVAVTMNPVNYNTYAEIVKGVQAADFVKPVFDEKTTNGGETYLLEYETENGDIVRINKDFSVKVVKKAMDLEKMKPLIKESLKRGVFDISNFDKIMKAWKNNFISNEGLKKIFLKSLIIKLGKNKKKL